MYTRTRSFFSITLVLLLLLVGCRGGSEDLPQNSVANDEAESSSLQETLDGGSTEQIAVHIGTLKGPTGMGMVGLMDRAGDGLTTDAYVFELSAAPEDMRTKVISGQVDIAALPTNMASVLYNMDEGSISVLAVNTLGVLYLLDSREEVDAIEDLSGQTVYATGQGAAPEYVLDYLLQANGLRDSVTVEFQSEHAELATLMITEEVSLGMLPEPFVTTTTNQKPDIRIALNLAEEWEKVSDGAVLAMGCIVVRNDFLEQNGEAVARFLEEYRQSVSFVNDNHEEAAVLMEEFDIIAQQVAVRAIPNCNIVYMDGQDMKSSVESFLQILWEANPQSVGGSLPDEAFYYLG